MAHYTPGNETSSTFKTGVQSNTSVLNEFTIDGATHRIFARTTTKTVEFRGLDASDAQSRAASEDYNYIDKHGVRFTSPSGNIAMSVAGCEGVECKADARRINEAGMWRLTVAYSETTTWHSTSGWTKGTF